MILESLVRAYSDLQNVGLVKEGWNLNGAVHYGIDVGRDGKVLHIITYVDDKKPKLMPVPLSIGKGTGTSNLDKFLYGSTRYLLGCVIDKKGKEHVSLKRKDSFEHTARYHHYLLDDVKSEASAAILNYFDYYCDNLDELHQSIGLSEHLSEYAPSYFVLCYKGTPVQNYDEISEVWNREFERKVQEESSVIATSAISGLKTTIARTHGNISGIGGTNPSLVSFNSPAFESYGKEQSYNAPIGVIEAIRYTSALNAMIKNPDYHNYIGDVHIVAWADGLNKEYSDTFFAMMGVSNAGNQKMLAGIVDHIVKGEPVSVNAQTLIAEQRFHIIGISAAGGRVIVEFFLENSFGELIKNIEMHNQRMILSNDDEHHTPVWQIISAIKQSEESNEKLEKKLLGSLFRSILLDTNYPDSIYLKTLDRIRKCGSADRLSRGGMISLDKIRIIKMFLAKNYISNSKEVIGLALNNNTNDESYNCGRLFAVLEKIQKDTGVENLSEKYFASAMTTPATAFAKTMRTNQYYMRKLPEGSKIYYDNLIQDITRNIECFSSHFSQVEQGHFCLGYYHQKQELYKKKENKETI